MKKKIRIIGSGFSSLASACYLANQGHEVTLYEKNQTIGGRARQLVREGFTFDIGPSWYWMPDVFERFFVGHGRQRSTFDFVFSSFQTRSRDGFARVSHALEIRFGHIRRLCQTFQRRRCSGLLWKHRRNRGKRSRTQRMEESGWYDQKLFSKRLRYDARHCKDGLKPCYHCCFNIIVLTRVVWTNTPRLK